MVSFNWHFTRPSAKKVFSEHPDFFEGIRDPRKRIALKKLFFDKLGDKSFAHYAQIARGKAVHQALLKAANSSDDVWRYHAYTLLAVLRPAGYQKFLSGRLRTEDDYSNRRRILWDLGQKPNRIPIRSLEQAVFDSHRSVRELAAEELVRRKGFSQLVFVLDRFFPEKTNRVTRPELFFQESAADPMSIREIEKHRQMGKQAFLHRGVPVYLVDSKLLSPKMGAKLPAMGRYIRGVLWVNSDPKVVPVRFRRAVAEHEVGEMFSHEIAQGLTLAYLDRHGQLSDYWGFYKDKPLVFVQDHELQQLCEKYPKDFGRLKRFFH